MTALKPRLDVRRKRVLASLSLSATAMIAASAGSAHADIVVDYTDRLIGFGSGAAPNYTAQVNGSDLFGIGTIATSQFKLIHIFGQNNFAIRSDRPYHAAPVNKGVTWNQLPAAKATAAIAGVNARGQYDSSEALTEKYFLFRFTDNSGAHYVRFDLKSWAYSTDNTVISAGQTAVPTPEANPIEMMLVGLTLGAVAVHARSKRTNKQAA